MGDWYGAGWDRAGQEGRREKGERRGRGRKRVGGDAKRPDVTLAPERKSICCSDGAIMMRGVVPWDSRGDTGVLPARYSSSSSSAKSNRLISADGAACLVRGCSQRLNALSRSDASAAYQSCDRARALKKIYSHCPPGGGGADSPPVAFSLIAALRSYGRLCPIPFLSFLLPSNYSVPVRLVRPVPPRPSRRLMF